MLVQQIKFIHTTQLSINGYSNHQTMGKQNILLQRKRVFFFFLLVRQQQRKWFNNHCRSLTDWTSPPFLTFSQKIIIRKYCSRNCYSWKWIAMITCYKKKKKESNHQLWSLILWAHFIGCSNHLTNEVHIEWNKIAPTINISH